ncbi:MAG TPA: hypothetical protein VM580_18905, partial [Labilithrix sp.]|nr:hypothetical protein [Labilithrix sp.]
VEFVRLTLARRRLSSVVRGPPRASSSPLKLLLPPEQPTLNLEHAVHVVGLLALITGVELLLGASSYSWDREMAGTVPKLGAIALLVGALVGLATLVAIVRASVMRVSARRGTPPGAGEGPYRSPAIRMTARLVMYIAAASAAAVCGSSWLSQPDRALFIARSTSIANGVSPFAVLLSAGTLLYVWTLCHMSRLRTLDGTYPRRFGGWGIPLAHLLPNGKVSSRDGRRHALAQAEMQLSRALRQPGSVSCEWRRSGRSGPQRGHRPGIVFYGITALLLVPPALLVTMRGIQTLESRWAGVLLAGCIVAGFIVICTTVARLFVFVGSLRKVLLQLRRHPILNALGRLPASQGRSVEAMTMAPATDPTELSVCVDMLATLALRRSKAARELNAIAPPTEAFDEWLQAARTTLNRHLRQQAAGEIQLSSADDKGAVGNEALARAARRLVRMLLPFWRGEPVEVMRGEQTSSGSHHTTNGSSDGNDPKRAKPIDLLASYQGLVDQDTLDWLRLAEQYVASLVARALGRTLRYFRHFVTCLVAGILLLILMVSLYALEPRRLLVTMVSVLTVVVATTAVGMLVAFERDPVLSAIANTTPGRVTWSKDLVGRIFTWGVVPLLAVFVAQYPETVRSVFSAFSPFTRAFP